MRNTERQSSPAQRLLLGQMSFTQNELLSDQQGTGWDSMTSCMILEYIWSKSPRLRDRSCYPDGPPSMVFSEDKKLAAKKQLRGFGRGLLLCVH